MLDSHCTDIINSIYAFSCPSQEMRHFVFTALLPIKQTRVSDQVGQQTVNLTQSVASLVNLETFSQFHLLCVHRFYCDFKFDQAGFLAESTFQVFNLFVSTSASDDSTYMCLDVLLNTQNSSAFPLDRTLEYACFVFCMHFFSVHFLEDSQQCSEHLGFSSELEDGILKLLRPYSPRWFSHLSNHLAP